MFFTKILEEKKSKFNGTLKVVKTWGMGTYIQAGGLTQSGGIVESIWKSVFKKINSKNLNAKSVLILGLGGGTVAKLVRKDFPNAKITGVDIDPIMIELGKKYLDLEVDKILIQDAGKSVPSKFDLVIVDLYQGDKFPKKFETENYIQLVRSLLLRSGVVVFNRLRYKNKKEEAEKFGGKLQKYFNKVEYHYPPANLMFICSKF